MSDLGNEMTNSLSRNGQGGMLSPLEFVDGSANTPSISFVQEPSLGWYKSATSVMALAALGNKHLEYDGVNHRFRLLSGASPAYDVIPSAAGGTPRLRLYDSAGFLRGSVTYNDATGTVEIQRNDDAGDVETLLTFNADGNVSVNGVEPNLESNLVRKDFVDNNDLLRVLKTGDTMTGQLDGITPVDAANLTRKDYVDNRQLAPSGTVLLFYQANAPTGWTKLTSQNNKGLRVVSGSGGVAGGSVPFSTVFGYTATQAHTLVEAEIPSHTHSYLAMTANFADAWLNGGANRPNTANQSTLTGATGGGGGHSHSIDMQLQYIDLILASKD
jgi:hypothetical protein